MRFHARRNALAFAFLLAAVPGAWAQTQIETGTLEASDEKLDSGEFTEKFEIQPEVGQTLVVTLVSLDFDPFLIVQPPQGDQIENDDLQRSKDVAQLVTQVTQPGTWTIRVTSYQAGETGGYVLLWRAVAADQAERVVQKQQEGTVDLTRLEPVAVMAATDAGPHTFEGVLEEGDHTLPDGELFDLYVVEAATGETLTFAIQSDDFDSYLAVASPSGKVSENDDDGQTTNSRLELQVDQGGRWYALVTTVAPLLKGGYKLVVTRGS